MSCDWTRYVAAGLFGIVLGQTGGAFAQTPLPTRAIGSWVVFSGSGGSTATLASASISVASAPSGGPGSPVISAPLSLNFVNGPTGFASSNVIVKVAGAPPGFKLPDAIGADVIADGKVVGQFSPNDARGFKLTTAFGADLAGLAAVKTLQVALNIGGKDAPILVANLSETAAALDAMKTGATVTEGVASGGSVEVSYGAWKIGASNGSGLISPLPAAIAVASARVGDDPAIKPSSATFYCQFRSASYYSQINLDVSVPAAQKDIASARLLADGKEVDRIPAMSFTGTEAYSVFDLEKFAGKDCKGLIPVRNLKVVISIPNANTKTVADTVIYDVNLSGTEFALARMVELAHESTPIPIKRPGRPPPPKHL